MAKRRFTDEQIASFINQLETKTVAEFAEENQTSIHTLYEWIRKYKREKKLTEAIRERLEQGLTITEAIEKLELGAEDAEIALAFVEGRKPRKVTRAWTLEQREEMWSSYCNGATAFEIADKYKTKPNKVYNQLVKHRMMLLKEIAESKGDIEQKKREIDIVKSRGVDRLDKESRESIEAEIEMFKPKEGKRKYKGPSIAELNKQAKMHNLTYGQYIAMKEMGLCQES